MQNASRRFLDEGFVMLPQDFLDHADRASMGEEARELLDKQAELRQVRMEATGNTPRHYRSVGRDAIYRNNGAIRRVFESDALVLALSKIAQEPVHRVPYEPEEYIVNNQCGVGHTHGWHWDDYSFAVIHVVESPDPLAGGNVEFIQDVPWDRGDSAGCIRQALASRPVTSLHVPAGRSYFMRTNTTLHRVAPLTSQANRIAVIMSFATSRDLSDASIGHETMETIYPKDTGRAAS